jgi:hypothetical protein
MLSFLSHPREALLRLFPNFDHYLAGMSATAFAAPGIGIAVALVTYMVRWDDQAQASGPLLPLVLGVLGSRHCLKMRLFVGIPVDNLT